LPVAARAWEPVGAPLSLGPATAVASAGKGVLCAAKSVERVDLEGACEALAGWEREEAVRALAADATALVVLTEAGRVFVSRDAGASFADVRGDAADVLAVGGELWVLGRGGALARSRDQGKTFDEPLGGARLAAIADGGGSLTVVTLDESGAPAFVLRDAGRGEGALLPPHEPIGKGKRARVHLAARGAHAAFAAAGSLHIGAGGHWGSIAGIATVRAMTFLDGEGTLLVATDGEPGETTLLVRVSPSGEACVVAEIDGGDACAMAKDDAHGVVWLAGGFGLLAFEGS
jgi:hypothetical protein